MSIQVLINFDHKRIYTLLVECYYCVLPLIKRVKETRNHFSPWDQANLVLNSIEKMYSFLLSLLCMFPESNRTKFWSHNFHLQNSGILQTRMDQRGDPMKTNFDIFQIQKWISQTVRAQKVDEENGVICLVSFFPA